ncbi:MAG: UDP-2,3-diacylglucosamine diphosphatase LpxI [Nitrospirae bacterium]|uniref:LpxI family protein n=1 Tax=Candidatus Magnetominusculus dajiuhuensis TaxID=3137712 RepID=UPI0019DE668C|nr:UDP-2,3-diacylglucosamine diphosphatase LpxI [Nitrospirota bacterium]
MPQDIENKTLGLIAGMGYLPMAVAQEARHQGYRVFAVGLEPVVDEAALRGYVDDLTLVNVAKLGTLIKTLKGAGLTEAVMAGKVPKSLLYKNKTMPDMRAVTFLLKLKDNNDDSILNALVEEFASEGITMRNITDFTSGMITPVGLLTKKGLSKDEQKDIDFGFPLAKEIGRLDIGQTIVIKGRAVMAVEAIEGTDMAIRRGGELAGSGAVVIKTSKPNQDKRFDYPAIGLDTIAAMKEVKARVLGLEAGNTLIVQKDAVIKEAQAAGISIIGVKY